jgi:hypothetical protein
MQVGILTLIRLAVVNITLVITVCALVAPRALHPQLVLDLQVGKLNLIRLAVVNITLVIAVCALVTPEPFTLNWYFVCRWVY